MKHHNKQPKRLSQKLLTSKKSVSPQVSAEDEGVESFHQLFLASSTFKTIRGSHNDKENMNVSTVTDSVEVKFNSPRKSSIRELDENVLISADNKQKEINELHHEKGCCDLDCPICNSSNVSKPPCYTNPPQEADDVLVNLISSSDADVIPSSNEPRNLWEMAILDEDLLFESQKIKESSPEPFDSHITNPIAFLEKISSFLVCTPETTTDYRRRANDKPCSTSHLTPTKCTPAIRKDSLFTNELPVSRTHKLLDPTKTVYITSQTEVDWSTPASVPDLQHLRGLASEIQTESTKPPAEIKEVKKRVSRKSKKVSKVDVQQDVPSYEDMNLQENSVSEEITNVSAKSTGRSKVISSPSKSKKRPKKTRASNETKRKSSRLQNSAQPKTSIIEKPEACSTRRRSAKRESVVSKVNSKTIVDEGDDEDLGLFRLSPPKRKTKKNKSHSSLKKSDSYYNNPNRYSSQLTKSVEDILRRYEYPLNEEEDENDLANSSLALAACRKSNTNIFSPMPDRRWSVERMRLDRSEPQSSAAQFHHIIVNVDDSSPELVEKDTFLPPPAPPPVSITEDNDQTSPLIVLNEKARILGQIFIQASECMLEFFTLLRHLNEQHANNFN